MTTSVPPEWGPIRRAHDDPDPDTNENPSAIINSPRGFPFQTLAASLTPTQPGAIHAGSENSPWHQSKLEHKRRQDEESKKSRNSSLELPLTITANEDRHLAPEVYCAHRERQEKECNHAVVLLGESTAPSQADRPSEVKEHLGRPACRRKPRARLPPESQSEEGTLLIPAGRTYSSGFFRFSDSGFTDP